MSLPGEGVSGTNVPGNNMEEMLKMFMGFITQQQSQNTNNMRAAMEGSHKKRVKEIQKIKNVDDYLDWRFKVNLEMRRLEVEDIIEERVAFHNLYPDQYNPSEVPCTEKQVKIIEELGIELAKSCEDEAFTVLVGSDAKETHKILAALDSWGGRKSQLASTTLLTKFFNEVFDPNESTLKVFCAKKRRWANQLGRLVPNDIKG